MYRNMKRFFLTMIAAAALTFAANAQQGNRPEPPTPEQTTERMAQQLELTDAQKSQVLALNTEYKDVIGRPFGGPGMGRPNGPRPEGGEKPDGVSGATNNGNPPAQGNRHELTEEQKAKFEEMRTKREEYNTKLKAILTDNQYAKYEESQKRGPHHGGHGKGDKGNKKNK
jgi:Spy/CpxP family protein refolding chaperone